MRPEKFSVFGWDDGHRPGCENGPIVAISFVNATVVGVICMLTSLNGGRVVQVSALLNHRGWS